MIESNFIDEKTKRHYLIIVDLLMNLFMSGFTIDLVIVVDEENNEEKILKSNMQLSDFFNFDITRYCNFTLIIKRDDIEGYIDLKFDYRSPLDDTFVIDNYSINLVEIRNETQKFSNYLNKF